MLNHNILIHLLIQIYPLLVILLNLQYNDYHLLFILLYQLNLILYFYYFIHYLIQ